MNGLPERDWKTLRAMKDELLNVACEGILKKVPKVIEESGKQSQEAYLKLWRLLREQDDEIAIMFDGLKRSNALQKLAAWRRNGLLTDEKLELFSEETRATVQFPGRP